MALEQITFNIGAFNDSDAGGNNYFTNTVFEVKNQSDNTFATIYADASGTTQIPQNGIDNISNSRGECNFYIDDGDFYLEVDSQQKNFNVGNFKTDFNNIDEVKAYSKLSKLIGQRITTGEYHAGTGYGGASYDVVSDGSVTPNGIDIIQGVADSGAAIVLHNTTDALKYGVYKSNTQDSYTQLQYLVSNSREVDLPSQFAISQPILYGDLTEIRGTSKQNCVCFMLSGFSGAAAFKPAFDGVNNPKIKNITFVDLAASNDGKGTDSTLFGIDITGTFRAECINPKGVRIDTVVFCDEGPSGVHQHTKRPKIEGVDGSNVNRLFDFVPTSEDRFPYGDIQIEDAYSSGSVRYGARAEDTDGFTWNGATMFPDAQLRVSGHYINISVCHPFEAKAKLTDGSGVTAESLIIPNRLGGSPSQHINIANTASAFAGRLADTTIGDPTQVNKSAFGVRIQNAINFVVIMSCNDPSEGAIRLEDCRVGNLMITSLRANTQQLGSGALPSGTYDVALLERCDMIIASVADNSPNKRYLAYLDDDCTACIINGVTEDGTITGGQVRLPSNNYNTFNVISKSGGVFKRYSPDDAFKQAITISDNNATPNASLGRNGAVIKFDNTASTLVTNIGDMVGYQEVVIHIQDNGATKLVDISNGGSFRTKGGANIQGRGYIGKFIRDPSTSEIVEV